MNELVTIHKERDGAWVRLVLSQPKPNLLSRAMMAAIRKALIDIREQSRSGRSLKWLTIEGAGTDFSFGAMIQEHVPGIMEMALPEMHALVRELLAFPACTAALVHGRCLGGAFELALACDVIIASEDATLGLPEIQLGTFAPAAAALLPFRVGASLATHAVLTGTARQASYWNRVGLISAVAPPDQLMRAAEQWFDAYLGPRSATAVAAAAEASRLALRLQVLPVIDAAERLYLDRALHTHDALEGVRAFLAKRPPQWKDR